MPEIVAFQRIGLRCVGTLGYICLGRMRGSPTVRAELPSYARRPPTLALIARASLAHWELRYDGQTSIAVPSVRQSFLLAIR